MRRLARASRALVAARARPGGAGVDVAARGAGAPAVLARRRPVRGRPAPRHRRRRRRRATPCVAPAAGDVSFAGLGADAAGRTVTIQTADGYAVTLDHLGSIGRAQGATRRRGRRRRHGRAERRRRS